MADVRIAVIVVNYRRAGLTIGCLESLAGEMAGRGDRCAVVVDNASDDGSPVEIERAIVKRGWSAWARLIRSPRNGGFAAGNNLGIRSQPAAAYLLLNSDARLRPGAIEGLLRCADEHPGAGLIGPRLEDPEGRRQVSSFRYRNPISEMLAAAATGPLTRLLGRCTVALDAGERVGEVPWVSFACVLIRREVIDRIGLMDEAYFLYFEDVDYARRARAVGFRVVYDPRPRVVHLRGGTSSVKAAVVNRSRIPRYYFESRSRYFAKFYGGVPGLLTANLLWLLGRGVSLLREVLGHKAPHVCAGEARDNWVNFLDPMRAPMPPQGGEL